MLVWLPGRLLESSQPCHPVVDDDIEWPRPESSLADVSGLLAAYNLVALPVIDESKHLMGAVTIDDVLDHLLPEGWRESSTEVVRHG